MTETISTPKPRPARGPRLPFSVALEPRLRIPKWLPWATSLGSVALALLLTALILLYVGGNPLTSFRAIYLAAFGNLGVFSDTLVKATPLILTGLACLLPFRMRLWNIGAEGQFYLGAWGATLIVETLFGKDASPWLFIPLMALSGFGFGALWGFIPGLLKARLNVNEIITTLMLNYIALFFVAYWVFGPWSERGFQMTPTFPRAAWLPRLADYATVFKPFSGLTVHLGFVFAVLACAAVWYLLTHTRFGYEIRLIGDNPNAAQYAGVRIALMTIMVMMLAGGLAGLGGMSEVTGVVHRLQDRISPGYGFTAIIVAWLAKLNPWAVIPVAILFGGLIIGSREIQPSGIARMLQGILLFTLISSEVLNRYRIKFERAK
ncbi:MAG: ABC transporter permease [Chloroflexi bacterium UTCFX4]|jgi:simple sugar transport system permease protein|nr:MAG: ABC transporter permease [Chloroflexi bacterium UTCFX4]